MGTETGEGEATDGFECVLRFLQQMAGGSRQIGIISHVTELKQEIEDQLIVSKDDGGSHIRWNII